MIDKINSAFSGERKSGSIYLLLLASAISLLFGILFQKSVYRASQEEILLDAFQEIAQDTHTAVIRLDDQSRIVQANRAFMNLMKVDNFDDIHNLSLGDIMAQPENFSAHLINYTALLRRAKAQKNAFEAFVQCSIVDNAGAEHGITVHAYALPDGTGLAFISPNSTLLIHDMAVSKAAESIQERLKTRPADVLAALEAENLGEVLEGLQTQVERVEESLQLIINHLDLDE